MRNAYDLAWHAINTDTDETRPIGGGGEAIFDDPGLIRPGAPLWVGEDRIAFEALVDGAIGLWQARIDGSGETMLVVRDANVEKASLSPDGSSILYTLGPSRDEIERAEQREYDSGILLDGSVDLGQNLYRGGSIDGRKATQRLVGYWFVRGGLLWRAPRRQWRLDLGTGRETLVGETEALEKFTPPDEWKGDRTSSSDGNFVRASWHGNAKLLEARLGKSARTITCSDPLCSNDSSWAAWIPSTHLVAFAATDGNMRQTLAIWDVDTGKVRRVAVSDGLISGGRSPSIPCAITRAAAFCVSAAAGSPPRVEKFDFESGRRTIIFDPNGALRATYSPKVEQLSWSARGIEFHGTLLTPARSTRRNLPLFVNFYWCDGFLRGGEGDAWPIPSLLDSGFAVACINSPSYTGVQDATAEYRDGMDGVRALVAELTARGLVDPARVGMGGFSHGSEIAMWTAMHSSLLGAVAISSAQMEPSSYWLEVIGSTDRAARIRSAWHLGAPDETPKQWKLEAPALNVDRLKAPILFQMPEQEARREPELMVRLGRSATPAEFYAYPDEDHFIVQPRHQAAMYERNLDWFRYWLKSEVDRSPSKQLQYERWDQMRTRACGVGRKDAPALRCAP